MVEPTWVNSMAPLPHPNFRFIVFVRDRCRCSVFATPDDAELNMTGSFRVLRVQTKEIRTGNKQPQGLMAQSTDMYEGLCHLQRHISLSLTNAI